MTLISWVDLEGLQPEVKCFLSMAKGRPCKSLLAPRDCVSYYDLRDPPPELASISRLWNLCDCLCCEVAAEFYCIERCFLHEFARFLSYLNLATGLSRATSVSSSPSWTRITSKLSLYSSLILVMLIGFCSVLICISESRISDLSFPKLNLLIGNCSYFYCICWKISLFEP